MKHIRNLEVDHPLEELLDQRAVERADLAEEQNAELRLFRGLIIALAISLVFWAVVLSALFG